MGRDLTSYMSDRWCGNCRFHGFKPGTSRNWCKITGNFVDQERFWSGCSYWKDRMEKRMEDSHDD